MKKVGVCAVFLAGVAVGSGVTAYFLNKRHRQEIASVKSVFAKYESEEKNISADKAREVYVPDEQVPDYNSPELKEARTAYIAKKQEDYTDYTVMYQASGTESNSDGEEETDQTLPRVISPDELGEDPDYNTICLTYFADGILAERAMEIVENPAFHVGNDFENHFGDFEEDAVHIRNDITRCYYEILKDTRTYAEAAKDAPGHIDY